MSKFGKLIEGTPFVPFKVPLVSAKLDDEQDFDLKEILDAHPRIGLIINLVPRIVNTITCDGLKNVHVVRAVCKPKGDKFLYLRNLTERITSGFRKSNPEKLIGVCCLTGCHYTAYVITYILKRSCKLSADDALSSFEDSRGELISDEIRNQLFKDVSYS